MKRASAWLEQGDGEVMKLAIDTRDRTCWPAHRWHPFPADATVVQATLGTGDVAIAGLEPGGVIERKTRTLASAPHASG
jgi:hypothetical protein